MRKQQRNFFSPVVTAIILLLSFFTLSQIVHAQPATGDAMQKAEVTWPHRLTLGLGAGLNLNFGSGDYTVDNNTYSKGFGAAPTFFALLEIRRRRRISRRKRS